MSAWKDTWKQIIGSKIYFCNTRKGNGLRIFIGITYAEVETPILWLSDAKSWLTGKKFDVGENWRQKEKPMAENEMIR